MEKNNSNLNRENFLTNINHNFEKNFDYDKEDLSIFQKETNENNINVTINKEENNNNKEKNYDYKETL